MWERTLRSLHPSYSSLQPWVSLQKSPCFSWGKDSFLCSYGSYIGNEDGWTSCGIWGLLRSCRVFVPLNRDRHMNFRSLTFLFLVIPRSHRNWILTYYYLWPKFPHGVNSAVLPRQVYEVGWVGSKGEGASPLATQWTRCHSHESSNGHSLPLGLSLQSPQEPSAEMGGMHPTVLLLPYGSMSPG